jgi:allophanate hydrolase
VYDVGHAGLGRILAAVPGPLAIGQVLLANGESVHGFLCESIALEGAQDITALGGWRAYISGLGAPDAPVRAL